MCTYKKYLRKGITKHNSKEVQKKMLCSFLVMFLLWAQRTLFFKGDNALMVVKGDKYVVSLQGEKEMQ